MAGAVIAFGVVTVVGVGSGTPANCGEAAALEGVWPGDAPVAPGLGAYALYGDCGWEDDAGESFGRLLGGKAKAAEEGVGEGDCCWEVGGEKAGAAGVGNDGCDCGWAIVAVL